jgi:hypothetical protein
MKLTNKQAMVMFDITKWSMAFVGGAVGYSSQTIEKLVNQIIGQQSDVLVELNKP